MNKAERDFLISFIWMVIVISMGGIIAILDPVNGVAFVLGIIATLAAFITAILLVELGEWLDKKEKELN